MYVSHMDMYVSHTCDPLHALDASCVYIHVLCLSIYVSYMCLYMCPVCLYMCPMCVYICVLCVSPVYDALDAYVCLYVCLTCVYMCASRVWHTWVYFQRSIDAPAPHPTPLTLTGNRPVSGGLLGGHGWHYAQVVAGDMSQCLPVLLYMLDAMFAGRTTLFVCFCGVDDR